MPESRSTGTTAPPDLPPPEYVNTLVEWAATYAGDIRECCASTGTDALPDPSDPNAVVEWVTTNFDGIEACFTSKGLPRPPHW